MARVNTSRNDPSANATKVTAFTCRKERKLRGRFRRQRRWYPEITSEDEQGCARDILSRCPRVLETAASGHEVCQYFACVVLSTEVSSFYRDALQDIVFQASWFTQFRARIRGETQTLPVVKLLLLFVLSTLHAKKRACA